MTRVILDKKTLSKLNRFPQGVEVCDKAGNVVGFFRPVVDNEVYRNIKIPISEKELRARERKGGGRSLSAILRDLEKREKGK